MYFKHTWPFCSFGCPSTGKKVCQIKIDLELCIYKYKSKKGLPLETKNTQNHENQRLGLIESLHMQHCSLQGCMACTLAPA